MNNRNLALSIGLLISFTATALLPATATPRSDEQKLSAIVDSYARAHGLPPEFARAVVQVESNWNPNLTGAAGEVGLMQIKFETARHLGYAGTRQKLYRPETNVKWGMKYLAGAWELGGGDYCQTVLRYQAGHGARTMTEAARTYCARLQRFMASAE